MHGRERPRFRLRRMLIKIPSVIFPIVNAVKERYGKHWSECPMMVLLGKTLFVAFLLYIYSNYNSDVICNLACGHFTKSSAVSGCIGSPDFYMLNPL